MYVFLLSCIAFALLFCLWMLYRIFLKALVNKSILGSIVMAWHDMSSLAPFFWRSHSSTTVTSTSIITSPTYSSNSKNNKTRKTKLQYTLHYCCRFFKKIEVFQKAGLDQKLKFFLLWVIFGRKAGQPKAMDSFQVSKIKAISKLKHEKSN